MNHKVSQNLKTSDALKRLGYRPGERLILEKDNVAVISLKELELLEDLEDVIESEKALAEPGESIPWEKVKEELGL